MFSPFFREMLYLSNRQSSEERLDFVDVDVGGVAPGGALPCISDLGSGAQDLITIKGANLTFAAHDGDRGGHETG